MTFDPEGSGYDYDGASILEKKFPLTIPRPAKYRGDYVTQDNAFGAWVWHPSEKKYFKHAGSLGVGGVLLKGIKHKSINETLHTERLLGNRIVKRKDGRYYSVKAVKGGKRRKTYPFNF